MKQYKTVDVDYTNCHPVIAEALKQGKHIWCRYTDKDIKSTFKVCGYKSEHPSYPYIGLNSYGSTVTYSKCIRPLETKKKFKSAPEIIQWCIDNGWVPAENTSYLFRETYEQAVDVPKGLKCDLIKFYVGKEYKPDEIHDMYIHPDWLEETV